MNLRWPAAVLALFGVGSGIPHSQRESETKPAMPFQFEWRSVRTACDPIPTSGAYLVAQRDSLFNLHRLDTLEFSRAELLCLHLNAYSSLVEVVGVVPGKYALQLCADVGAATETDARRVLEGTKLSRDGDTITVMAPSSDSTTRSMAHLRVSTPGDRPVRVSGTYSAVAVHGVQGAVNVATTHARITLIDTKGDVEATVGEFGIIDFSGQSGNVRLSAPTEVNINITAKTFAGRLTATAERPVKVLIPTGFASTFEAVVARRADFVCRADLCGQVVQSKRSGRFVFKFGDGDPILTFTSHGGPVVIDSRERVSGSS